MWKKLIICLLAMAALYCSLEAPAAESKREQIKKKANQKKKTEDVVWEKDIKSAIAKAKKSKKYILLVHIAPKVNNNSKLFYKNIIENKKVLYKASKALVFVKFEYENLKKVSKEAAAAIKTYPIAKRGNSYVMPTVYLLDSAGNVLEQKGFEDKDAATYLKSFKSMKNLKKK